MLLHSFYGPPGWWGKQSNRVLRQLLEMRHRWFKANHRGHGLVQHTNFPGPQRSVLNSCRSTRSQHNHHRHFFFFACRLNNPLSRPALISTPSLIGLTFCVCNLLRGRPHKQRTVVHCLGFPFGRRHQLWTHGLVVSSHTDFLCCGQTRLYDKDDWLVFHSCRRDGSVWRLTFILALLSGLAQLLGGCNRPEGMVKRVKGVLVCGHLQVVAKGLTVFIVRTSVRRSGHAIVVVGTGPARPPAISVHLGALRRFLHHTRSRRESRTRMPCK